MGEKSNISWTDASWNAVTGCSKVSEGCRYCYAETLSLRMGWSDAAWTFPNAARNVVLHPERLDMPLRWKRPRMIFVNSMSDLFHELVPDKFIRQIFAIMAASPQHTFQVLTKRPERMRAFVNDTALEDVLRAGESSGLGFTWKGRGSGVCMYGGPRDIPQLPLPNVWLGTSVENQRAADERIPHLLDTPAAVRFLSCEPLLGPLDLTGIHYRGMLPNVSPGVDLPFDVKINALTGASFDGWDTEPPSHDRIGWVIVGGESGSHLTSADQDDRWMDPAWARDIRDQCVAAGVPFFMKQHSAKRPGQQPYIIEADHSHTEWHQFPEAVAQ
jgi:protein gp37